MSLYEKHVFICQNERPATDERGFCSQKEAFDFRNKLKAKIKTATCSKKFASTNRDVWELASMEFPWLFIRRAFSTVKCTKPTFLKLSRNRC